MSKNNIERRATSAELRMQTGADNEPTKIVGYAAKFNTESAPLYNPRTGSYFVEVIEEGFFDDAISDTNIRALFNHDQNQILARNGVTMTLTTDEVGLRYEFTPPNTTLGNDLVENIRLGNIDQSSFAFSLKENDAEEWRSASDRPDGVTHVRRLKPGGAARLYDVSPVTYPAYPDATVALRSFEHHEEKQKPETHKKEVSFDLLQKEIDILKLK